MRVAGQRQHQEAEADQHAPRRDDRDRDHRGRGDHHEHGVEQPGAPVAEHHREGALAGDGVGRDVAQVVGDQDRAGQGADADGRPERRPLPGLGLDVRRADDRDEPEEDEHHDLAEAEVAVGLRAAGVEPRGQHRHDADGQQPPGGRRGQGQARDRGHAEGQERRPLHRSGRCGARPDQPQRTDPVGVGAADAVGVVVGVVDRHLEREGDDEREQRLPPHDGVDVRRDAGAGEHGGDGCGEGARSRAGEPLCGSCHNGRFKQPWPEGGHLGLGSPRTRVGRVNPPAARARSSGCATGWRPTTPSRGSSRPRARRAARSGSCCRARPCSPRSRPAPGGSAGRVAGCSRCRRRTSRACRSSAARWSPVTSRCCSTSTRRSRRRPRRSARAPRFVSLVPTQLHRLLETDADALRSFHTVLLGGGPIDAGAATSRGRRPGCGWSRRTARRRPRAAASTTATRSTASRSRSTPGAGSGSPGRRSSSGTTATPT